MLVVAGCAAGEGESDATKTAAGKGKSTLTFAVPSFPGGWDQDFIGFDPVALALYKNMMLYTVDYAVTTADGGRIQDTQNIVPTFAESFTSDDSGKVWTLKLRPGVKFPSGNELTADDVKWSKDRAFAAQANVAGIYRLIGLTKPEQVTVVDTHTVKFEQSFPSALAPQIQAICLYVYDSVEAKKHATADDPWAKEWIGKNPQDGGYYNVKSSVQDQQIVLAANPAYTGPEPAQVATIRMPVVPSAANLRLQLQNGDVDVAMGLSRRDIKDLKSQSGIEVISSPNNEMVAIEMSVTTAPFDDVRVRQAFAYAMPYEQIIKNVFDGDARPVKSPVPLEMPGYSDKGYPYEYDLDKARALLKEAGKSSISTELAFAANDDEQQQLAVLVANELKKIGVTVKLSPLDPATFADRRGKKTIPFQIAYGQQWVNDVEYLLSTSLTKSAYLNYSNYSEPEIEKIFERSHAIADQNERLALWARVQEILARDVPWLVLCQPNFNLPVRKGISGWVQPVDGLFRLRYLTAK
jgi:peptide/nickel transport system substrate-binding protein